MTQHEDRPQPDADQAFARFHNALRALSSIDRDQLERAGVVVRESDWQLFRENPWRWFILAPAEWAHQVWRLMEDREHIEKLRADRSAPRAPPPCTYCGNGSCWPPMDVGTDAQDNCRACGRHVEVPF
jgi:hypothetical protein